MNKRIMALGGLLFAGCIKEISNEDRLDRETTRIDALKSPAATELKTLKCDDLSAELPKARDESATEEKRLLAYSDLYAEALKRSARFEEVLRADSDLAYQEGNTDILVGRDRCTQTKVEVRLEFETLVREIVGVPIVDEYHDGKTLKAPRLNFAVLRGAIEKLNPDDKDALLARVASAEKQIEDRDASKRKREK